MTFHSGIQSTAKVADVELPTTKWNVDPKVEIVEFKNSKTGTFAQKEATYQDCPFTIEVDYDFDANPFGVTPGLKVGTVLTDVKLYLRGTAGDYWDFPTSIVVGTPQSVESEGKVTTTINCTNSGPYGYPGTPVA